MASTRQIKSRIRSVSSNRQITKAMELVAASKLRRAQSSALAARAYSDTASEILNALNHLTDIKESTLYAKRPLKTRLVVLITSDRGLAGAYNANVIRELVSVLKKDDAAGVATHVIAIGKKGAQFVARLKNAESTAVYSLPEQLEARDIRPILNQLVESFVSGEVDSVDVISTQFISSLNQKTRVLNLLPAGIDPQEAKEAEGHVLTSATFEPSLNEVLDYVTIRLLEGQLFQAVLDAYASEHSMRRVAMKNASDNAGDIIDDLTLEMNKVRQAGITQELSEISAGVEAMK